MIDIDIPDFSKLRRELGELHDWLAGALADEGWPEPYHRVVNPAIGCTAGGGICWRKSSQESALVLDTHFSIAPEYHDQRGKPVMQHVIHVYGIAGKQYVVVDLAYGCRLPGFSPPRTKIRSALRLFRSVIEVDP